MKIEEIEEEWKKDCVLDKEDLATEALRIPKLHAKYLGYWYKEDLFYKKMLHDFDSLKLSKTQYYQGKMPEEDLKELKWDRWDLDVKKELNLYMMADEDMKTALMKLELQEDKVEMLKLIIKKIEGLGFTIKNAIDFIKFTTGF